MKYLKQRKNSEWDCITRLCQRKPQSGKIVAVGSGRVLDNGTKEPLEVAEGDTVIFAKYSGTEVTYEGTDYLILRESDILAITK